MMCCFKRGRDLIAVPLLRRRRPEGLDRPQSSRDPSLVLSRGRWPRDHVRLGPGVEGRLSAQVHRRGQEPVGSAVQDHHRHRDRRGDVTIILLLYCRIIIVRKSSSSPRYSTWRYMTVLLFIYTVVNFTYFFNEIFSG